LLDLMLDGVVKRELARFLARQIVAQGPCHSKKAAPFAHAPASGVTLPGSPAQQIEIDRRACLLGVGDNGNAADQRGG
jgi:hypothetical protein